MRKVILILILLGVIGAAGFAWHALQARQSDANGTQFVVSFGDSIAAGAGLAPLDNASATDTACLRSGQAYPYAVASHFHATVKQFACSGAKVTEGLLEPQAAGSQSVPAQLTAAQPFMRGNIVLVTIGANDVGWTKLLQQCLQTNCEDPALTATFQQSLETLRANLDASFGRIAAERPAFLIVNQYYDLLNPAATCFASYGVTADKITWVNDRTAELNDVISQAARAHGGRTVHVDFASHQLCSANSDIQGLLDAAPLHPTASGQQVIANQDETVPR